MAEENNATETPQPEAQPEPAADVPAAEAQPAPEAPVRQTPEPEAVAAAPQNPTPASGDDVGALIDARLAGVADIAKKTVEETLAREREAQATADAEAKRRAELSDLERLQEDLQRAEQARADAEAARVAAEAAAEQRAKEAEARAEAAANREAFAAARANTGIGVVTKADGSPDADVERLIFDRCLAAVAAGATWADALAQQRQVSPALFRQPVDPTPTNIGAGDAPPATPAPPAPPPGPVNALEMTDAEFAQHWRNIESGHLRLA